MARRKLIESHAATTGNDLSPWKRQERLGLLGCRQKLWGQSQVPESGSGIGIANEINCSY